MGFLINFLPLLLAVSVFAASPNSEPIVYGYDEDVYTKLSFPGVRVEGGMVSELADLSRQVNSFDFPGNIL